MVAARPLIGYLSSMRIIRFIPEGTSHPLHGVELDNGMAVPLTGPLFDHPMPSDREPMRIDRILAPISPPAILCIGMNYRAHATEQGLEPPQRPVLFIKNPAAVVGPGEAIVVPQVCQDREQVDFEGELAVVIGRRCRDVRASEAVNHILGYTVANDVSARWWQKSGSGGQFCRGKSFDTFCPLGPAIVTPDELRDPAQLRLQTRVNGETMQDANTEDMIFSVPDLIAFLSQGTTLLPGTVILTGTPSGVGFARKPPVWLQHGDAVEIEIEQIGTLKNRVRFEAP